MATLASYGAPRVHGDTLSPPQSPSTYTPIREPINVPKKSNTFSTSLDDSLSESMSSPRRPMSPTLGGAAAAMKKFLRRRRGTACEGDSPQQQHHHCPSMLQTFVLVGGVGAESGTTIYDTHIPSSPPSLFSSIPLPVASVTKPQNYMATPPISPINNIGTMMLRNDRGRDIRRGAYSVSRHLSSENNPSVEHISVVGHKGMIDSTPKDSRRLRRSLSADSLPPFQARSSSLHRNHRRSTLGLHSAMEMLNVESLDQSLMVKASSWDDDQDDEGCTSADVSLSSLLATDLEMLDSLKNEHRQGGCKRTVAKEKKQQQKPPQFSSRRQKSSIYQASMEFLASYHGPAHTGQGEFSARYLKKEKGKRPDWSIERSIPDLSPKTDKSGRSRFVSVASNSATTLLLQTEDEGILLVSTRPTPTQFYGALKTRKALQTLVTDNEQEFQNMLERGFLWSPVSELLDPYSQDDDDDPLEDQDLMLPSVPPQYFMTLRITLTPWHARADESEIYGHFGSRQASIPTIIRKMSAYSLTSNASPLLSPAASTTSLSLDSSISSDSSPSPSTPLPRDGSPESECPFKKAIKSAPFLLERSSSLLRSKKQINRSPHASPKLTGRPLKASHPSSSVPCHPLDAPVHPFDQESPYPQEGSLPGTISTTSTLLSSTLLSPSSRDQSLPPRKGSLSSRSLPLPNTHGIIGEVISPPEKSKGRMRDHTQHATSLPMVPTRKGSTPAIFYSPPGCNSSELLIEQGPPTRPQSVAPRSLSMSGTPRPRTNYAAPSLRAAARQPSSIPVRKRSDQSDVMSANLAACRMNEAERTSIRAHTQACRQNNSGWSPQLVARGSPEEHQRAGELNDHLPSTQQRLHSRNKQAASYASALPVLKSRRQVFYETSEGPSYMDYRDASNYSLVSPTNPPLGRPRHFWSSKEKASGNDPLATNIHDYHMSGLDNHRHVQDTHQTNESHGKAPFTVSGVAIVPRSVHQHMVKVDRGFIITNNSRNESGLQDGGDEADATTSSGEATMSEKAVAAQESGCWRPVRPGQTPAMQTFAFP